MDTISLTLVAGFALALLVLAALFGSLAGLRDRSTLVLVFAGYVGVKGAFLLSDPENHLSGLNALAHFTWFAVVFLLLPLAWEDNRSISYGMMALATASLVGAIGTKAAELSSTRPRQDLHTTNIWLLITSVLFLLAYFASIIADNHKKKAAKKNKQASPTSCNHEDGCGCDEDDSSPSDVPGSGGFAATHAQFGRVPANGTTAPSLRKQEP